MGKTEKQLGRKETISKWGKKVGRKRTYKTPEEAHEARKNSMREYQKRKQRERKLNENKEESENPGEEEKLENPAVIDIDNEGERKDAGVLGREINPDDVIDIDNEEERRLAGVLSLKTAAQGEFRFDKVEDFATKVEVQGDGNCGYYALRYALLDKGKECKKSVREIRKDIREFACNHREHFNKETTTETVLNAIFEQNIQYSRVNVEASRWMDGCIVLPIASRLYNAIIYLYLEKENETKRTYVYRPCGKNSEVEGFISMMKDDSAVAGEVLRLWCHRQIHFNWLKWGSSAMKVKKEKGIGKNKDARDTKDSESNLDDTAVAEMMDSGMGEMEETSETATADVAKMDSGGGGMEETNSAAVAVARMESTADDVEVNAAPYPECEDSRPYPPLVLGRTWGKNVW